MQMACTHTHTHTYTHTNHRIHCRGEKKNRSAGPRGKGYYDASTAVIIKNIHFEKKMLFYFYNSSSRRCPFAADFDRKGQDG